MNRTPRYWHLKIKKMAYEASGLWSKKSKPVARFRWNFVWWELMIKENYGLKQIFHQNEQNTSILALEKRKNSQKWHIIAHGGQTVRLTTKSHKKPNILHKISFPHSGLRFLIRPTVCPQFTKIGGAKGVRKKNFGKFFIAFSQHLGPPRTISIKKFQKFWL